MQSTLSTYAVTPSSTVRQVMHDNVLTVQTTDPLRLAVQMMLWGGFRHLPVMRGAELAGMITDHQVYQAQAREEVSNDTPVAALMTNELLAAEPEQSVADVAATMAAARVHSLPVIERGRLIGIVTSHDILAELARGYETPPMATIADVMCPDPECIHADDDLLHAMELMVEDHIRHLPVVDDFGRIVGILSDRDLRDAVGDPVESLRDSRPALPSLRVADVMTLNPITITPDSPLADLGWSLLEERVGAVPVVDDDDRLIGIVSYVDVLRHALRDSG